MLDPRLNAGHCPSENFNYPGGPCFRWKSDVWRQVPGASGQLTTVTDGNTPLNLPVYQGVRDSTVVSATLVTEAEWSTPLPALTALYSRVHAPPLLHWDCVTGKVRSEGQGKSYELNSEVILSQGN